jgi:hypothetical protein
MKNCAKYFAPAVIVFIVTMAFAAQEAEENGVALQCEYNVMSLAEMFSDAPNAAEMLQKILELTVQVQGGPGLRRTDLDVPDYDEALNRLADDGWELVTVTKSNYWVFRRAK